MPVGRVIKFYYKAQEKELDRQIWEYYLASAPPVEKLIPWEQFKAACKKTRPKEDITDTELIAWAEKVRIADQEKKVLEK